MFTEFVVGKRYINKKGTKYIEVQDKSRGILKFKLVDIHTGYTNYGFSKKIHKSANEGKEYVFLGYYNWDETYFDSLHKM